MSLHRCQLVGLECCFHEENEAHSRVCVEVLARLFTELGKPTNPSSTRRLYSGCWFLEQGAVTKQLCTGSPLGIYVGGESLRQIRHILLVLNRQMPECSHDNMTVTELDKHSTFSLGIIRGRS